MPDKSTDGETDASLLTTQNRRSEPFDVELADIHALSAEKEKIRQTFLDPMVNPAAPIRAPAVIVYGPEGVGKIRFARALVSELINAGFDAINITDGMFDADTRHHQSPADDGLSHLIGSLNDSAPTVVLIERLEEFHISPDGRFHSTVEKLRETNARVAVVATLSQSDQRIDPEHTPAYFEFADVTLKLSRPEMERRVKIFEDILSQQTTGTAHTLDADLERVMTRVGEDFPINLMDDISRRAMLLAGPPEPNDRQITTEHIVTAINQLMAEQPKSSDDSSHYQNGETEFQPDIPAVTFDDVGGLDGTVERLRERLVYSQEYGDLYENSHLSTSTGVLLHGPPGTGKTLLAKALANETERPFYAIEGAAVKSKWLGESEERVTELFRVARNNAPSILFFDEFDALAVSRKQTHSTAVQSIVNTLLAELDGVGDTQGLFVLAATNRREIIDSAVRRSGRIDESIEVPTPTEEGQRDIFQVHTRDVPITDDVDPVWFASKIPDGSTGADIAVLVENALHSAIRQTEGKSDTPTITRQNILSGIDAYFDDQSSTRRGYY